MAKKIIVSNRKARFDYEILETFEAGIELRGSEVKSLRDYKANLKGSFGRIEGEEVFLYNFQISPYRDESKFSPDPKRKRKLLLHKNEIRRLVGKCSERGLTLIPLSAYFKRGLVKIEFALCKGKKKYDKRQELKLKNHQAEIKKALKCKK
jgi:SsrA-binding protein